MPALTVSVVIPAFNAEPWIRESVESVLAQSRQADEIVVVDDGSTDGTAAAVAAYQPDVRLIQQANGGCAAAFNTGFANVTGTHVALCTADDIWVPEKLAIQLESLTEHPQADVVFGAATYFGRFSGEFPRPAQVGLLDTDRFAHTMYERCVIPDPSAIVRRSLHATLNGYDESIIGEDYEFWWRAIATGARFCFVPDVLVHLRQHDSNLSSRAVEIWNTNLAVHRRHAKFVDDPKLVNAVISNDLVRLGRSHWGAGQLRSARLSYGESLRHKLTAHALAARGILAVPGLGRLANRLAAILRSKLAV